VQNVNESSTVFDARKWCAEALFAGRFRRGGWIERRSRTREGIASVARKAREICGHPHGSSQPLILAHDEGATGSRGAAVPRTREGRSVEATDRFARAYGMITIGIIRKGTNYLSLHLRKNDYCSEGEKEVQGEWIPLLTRPAPTPLPVAPEIAVAEVVGENHHDIRRPGRSRRDSGRPGEKQQDARKRGADEVGKSHGANVRRVLRRAPPHVKPAARVPSSPQKNFVQSRPTRR
jgi:hypothetical protein